MTRQQESLFPHPRGEQQALSMSGGGDVLTTNAIARWLADQLAKNTGLAEKEPVSRVMGFRGGLGANLAGAALDHSGGSP